MLMVLSLRIAAAVGFVFAIIVTHASRADAYCTGDCDGNGTVSNTEAVNCRGIAFGSRPLAVCQRCDCDEDGAVSDSEFMRAEQNAAGSCAASECPSATGTPRPSPTATPSFTSSIPTRTRTPTAPAATQTATATPPTNATATLIAPACVGDCDDNRTVVVNEVVTGVNIALDRATVATCVAFDPNQTTTVTVSELVQGVNSLLRGCPE